MACSSYIDGNNNRPLGPGDDVPTSGIFEKLSSHSKHFRRGLKNAESDSDIEEKFNGMNLASSDVSEE